jgi:hypothetical protein
MNGGGNDCNPNANNSLRKQILRFAQDDNLREREKEREANPTQQGVLAWTVNPQFRMRGFTTI